MNATAIRKTTGKGRPALFLVLAVLSAGLASAGPGDKPLFRPERAGSPPVIDGRLDDAVWGTAQALGDFKSYSPDFGREPTERTTAYMAYDAENIYFAFKCYDREPDKIKAALAERDTIKTDDFICINLDTFNDRQALSAFYVNPLGIQSDSRFAAGQEDFSVDFVWESAGRIDADGYSVELRIPFKSMRYAGKKMVEMAIVFERFISRRAEHVVFPAFDPARGLSFLTQMMPLQLENIRRYTLVEVLPAFTYRKDSAREDGAFISGKGEPEFHLTGKYGITSKLILDATWNPDFSQIEADAGQIDINLRSDIYYAEKRPFFLEGSELFQIGTGTTGLDPLSSIVHTRTMIDPLLGLKLTGKLGDRDTIASIFALDESPSTGPSYVEGNDKYAGFSVFRYKRSVTADGFLGAIYTGREYGEDYNRVAGVDGQLRITKSSMLSFHGLGSWTRTGEEGAVEKGAAGGADYVYDTRNIQYSLVVYDISEDFRTGTGYLTRSGVAGAHFNLQPRFYPKSGFFRKISIDVSVGLIKDLPSGLLETNDHIGVAFLLPGRTTFLLAGYYSTEVFLGRRFDTGYVRAGFASQISKQVYFSLTGSRGDSIRYLADPYQGYGSRITASVIYKPSERFEFDGSLTYADFFRGSTREKDYDYAIWRARMTYQMNRYLFFRGVVEYNSYRREMLTDLLASFTYIPGTVIQLGYGSLYDRTEWADGLYRDSDRFLELIRGLFFKASYLWRL